MFSQQERLIFHYQKDGVRHAADPLGLRRSLLRHSGGSFFSWLEATHEPEVSSTPEGELSHEQLVEQSLQASRLVSSLEAQERVLDCVRKAFGLAPIDPATGEGTSEAQCWAVLDSYLDYMEGNGSRGENSQTTSPADSRPEKAGD